MEPFSTWKAPEKKEDSYITGLKVRNSLKGDELTDFIPMNGRKVSWYMCGPTVYDSAHLGHARTYIAFDMIKKIMRDYFGYDILLAMNITNIDDKIINRSNEVGEDFTKFAEKWENDFFEDMKMLNVELPDSITRVSEFVDIIIPFIQKIIDRGFAYESNGSVYFDTEAYRKSSHAYGKLAPSKVGDLELLKEGEGSRNAKDHDKDKKTPFDFALWKNSKPDEPKWKSPWGEGRPGWHIECSVMADKVLGYPIDIHSGGVDLKFPHHENEIAQTEAYHDHEQWVNFFIHSGHLHIDGMKMSKSLKNFIKIKTMVNKYSARQLRLLFLRHKYDSLMNYYPAEEELEQQFLDENPQYKGSKGSMGQIIDIDKKYGEFFISMKSLLRVNPITKSQIWTDKEFELEKYFTERKINVHKAFTNNFDTPGVLKELDDLISATYTYTKKDGVKYPLLYSITSYVFKTFQTMGINYEDKFNLAGTEQSGANVEETAGPFIDALAAFRDKIRKAAKDQDFKLIMNLSDEIRDDVLPFLGVRIEDKGIGEPSLWKFDDKDELIKERNKKLEEKEKKEQEKKKKEEEKKKKEAELEAKSKIPPAEFLKNDELYSKYDEKGIPTHDKSGEELSKGKRKAAIKDYEKQEKLHNQWLAKNKDVKEQ